MFYCFANFKVLLNVHTAKNKQQGEREISAFHPAASDVVENYVAIIGFISSTHSSFTCEKKEKSTRFRSF